MPEFWLLPCTCEPENGGGWITRVTGGTPEDCLLEEGSGGSVIVSGGGETLVRMGKTSVF